MARIGKKVRLRFAGLSCFLERFILLDLRLDRLILRKSAKYDIDEIHHGKTRVICLRELIPRISKRRIHIDDHDQEKDHVEV